MRQDAGGSMQLRLYRIARRDGASRSEACAASGIGEGEARLQDADDAKNPPGPGAYILPRSYAARLFAGMEGTPLAEAAIERISK